MKHKPPISGKKSLITALNDRQAESWQKRLQKVMAERNISQRQLAEAAGLGATTVRHAVTKAKTITIETLRRLSNATDLPLNYLLTGSNTTITDLTDAMTHEEVVIIPVHDVRGDPTGGTAMLDKRTAGKDPSAMRQNDNSMMGIGSNFQPDLHDIVLPGDVVVYDRSRTAEPGNLVVYNNGGAAPHFVTRLMSYEEGEYYAEALTRSHGRFVCELEQIQGTVTAVLRRRGEVNPVA